jgi:competence protein ComEA
MRASLYTVALALALLVAVPAWAAKKVSGVANLNNATPAQLVLLPGVGEKAAARIVEHRKKTPFTRVEELVKVKGFGKKKFDKLKPHLAVSGATTLKAEKAQPAAKQGRKGKPSR